MTVRFSGSTLVALIGRIGDCRQNTNDRYDDHEFNQGEAIIVRHGVVRVHMSVPEYFLPGVSTRLACRALGVNDFCGAVVKTHLHRIFNK